MSPRRRTAHARGRSLRHAAAGRRCRCAALALLTALAAATFGAPVSAGPAADPGLVLNIDTRTFVLRATDQRDATAGPELPVALGSPAHPTPRGRFTAGAVVLEPGWRPGPLARRAGARPSPPGAGGPLGLAKIPFAEGGAISIHGGAHPLVLGKPISLGCVRTADADLARLLAWLDARGALAAPRAGKDGARVRPLRRTVRVVVD